MHTSNTDIQFTLGSIFTTRTVPSRHETGLYSIHFTQHQSDNSFYPFTSQHLSKSFYFLNVTVIIVPTAHTHLHLTQTQETFPCSEELSIGSYRGLKTPVHISHLIHLIMTFKKSSDVSTANYYIYLISCV